MIVVKEVTEWNVTFPQPNHILFLSNDKSKCYAMINSYTGERTFFKNTAFYPRYRKFELIKQVEDKTPDGIEVRGSKGDIYYVTEKNGGWKCSCIGYKYHSSCKHIQKVSNGN